MVMERTALISEDGLYRYALGRRWSETDHSFATFVMLNPSTADAEVDDPTIRRCIGFAQSWGLGGLHVLNLYALRATKPSALWIHEDPVGPENDVALVKHAMAHRNSGWPFVAAWGANAKPGRVADVLDLPGMTALSYLALTKDGAPRHPLYLKGDLKPIPWEWS